MRRRAAFGVASDLDSPRHALGLRGCGFGFLFGLPGGHFGTRQEAGGLRTVGFYLTGISHEELNSLKQAMLENIRGLKEIRVRDYSEGNAYLEVGYRGTGTRLAKEIETLEWRSTIRLLGVTQNRLEAKIEH